MKNLTPMLAMRARYHGSMQIRNLSWLILLAACEPEREPVGTTSSALAGTWASVGTLTVPRGLFSTELRSIAVTDGRVLVAGGANMASQSRVDVLDGTTGAPSMGTSLAGAREMYATIALSDGSALAAGGQNRMGMMATVLRAAERWNASSGAWSAVGDLVTARAFSSATRLVDGRVLVVGGSGTFLGPGLTSAELFNPTTNTFAQTTGSTTFGRFGHVAALLPNGKVIIIGGNTGQGAIPPFLTEIFDPTTQLFSAGPNMVIPRIAHAGARLLDGRILYCGGCLTADCSAASHATCEIYDPASGVISSTGSLSTGAGALSLVTLATGEVLATGGITSATAQSRAELYDPTLGTWSTAGTMGQARYDGGIALLRDGRAVVSGGRQGTTSMSTYVSGVEVYTPATLPVTCQVCQIDGSCVTLRDGTVCTSGACQSGVCAKVPDASPQDVADADAADADAADAPTQDASDATADSDGDSNGSDVADTSPTDANPSDGTPHDVGPRDGKPPRDVNPIDAVATPDVGVTSDAAQGANDAVASADSGQPSPSPNSGCGCRTTSVDSDASPIFLALALLLRRRRLVA